MNQETGLYLQQHREQTPANLAARLAADPFLASDIPTDVFSAYLAGSGVFLRLLATVTHPACPPELAGGIRGLLFFLSTPARWIGTANPLTAQAYADALNGLVALRQATGDAGIGISPDEAAQVQAMGGGLRYDRLTEVEIAAALTEMERTDAIAALRARLGAASFEAGAALDRAIGEGEALPAWETLAGVFTATEGE